MPILLLPEQLFEREPVFGVGIIDVFKGIIGKVKKFVPTKEGIRFFTGTTSLGSIADRVLPLIQPLLNQAIEKGIPLLTESALLALGGLGSQASQAALRQVAIPASKRLSKALIKKLEARVQEGVKRIKGRKKKRSNGGRLIKPKQFARGGRAFPKNFGPNTAPPLNPRNKQFLQQLLQMNTIRGSGLMEL